MDRSVSKVYDLLVILASLEEVQTAIQTLNDDELVRACLEVSRFITNKVTNELDDLSFSLRELKQ